MASEHEIEKIEDDIEGKIEEDLVHLISKIIVDKIMAYAREKGYTIPEVQSGQTKLPFN